MPTASAIDIAGCVFASEEKAMVAHDQTGDDAKARVIRDVHDGACQSLVAVLSPDDNAAHRGLSISM